MENEKSLSRQDSKQRAARVRGVKLWTRFSPLHVFRVFRDTYVKNCVTVGNSSKLNAVAHSAAFRITSNENSFSRSNSSNCRDDFGSAQDILDLSAKFSREVLEQESVQSGRKHLATVATGHHGLTLADLRGYGGHSSPLRVRPSFDSVPESEQFTDSNASRMSLDVLLQASANHPTGFLQSPSRRVTALSGYYQLGIPPRNSDYARPPRRLHTRYASASVPHIPISTKPLTPITDMSTFREQSNGRKSYDLPRASSRRRERLGSTKSASMHSRSSPEGALVCDLPGTRSGKPHRTNPYSFYDTRLPSPAPTV